MKSRSSRASGVGSRDPPLPPFKGLPRVALEKCQPNTWQILFIDRFQTKVVCYDGKRIFEEDWVNTPLPREIKKGKRHFWSKKEESYVDCGWVKTIETTQIQYILSKYKVKIYL